MFTGGSEVIRGILGWLYRLKYIELVPNLSTRACGGTIIYQNAYTGDLWVFQGELPFFHMSLKCKIWMIYNYFQIWLPGFVVEL